MIRFVDLRPARIAGYRFAFWNTTLDRFVEDEYGDQAWGNWDEVTGVLDIDRLKCVTPAWVFVPMTEAEEQV